MIFKGIFYLSGGFIIAAFLDSVPHISHTCHILEVVILNGIFAWYSEDVISHFKLDRDTN